MGQESFEGESGRRWTFDNSKRLGDPGGFGTVYEGEGDDGLPVAVKVVGLQGTISAVLLRGREKEIAQKLSGVEANNLIKVLDTAEDSERVLLVMERAEQSLASSLKASPRALPPGNGLRILRDVTTGLKELHQGSIIHRDLKPDNVLLHQGTWKLGDFGIARDVEIGTQHPTFLGWGSRPYMAPETWRGESPTFKTDLYSLGCMAHEVLSGESPFPGPEEEDFRRQHLEEPPPALQVGSTPPLGP